MAEFARYQGRAYSRRVMSVSEDDDGNESGEIDLFAEPEGWAPPEKPCTFQSYTIEEKNDAGKVESKDIKLRLVGSSPLWGHLLWNAARTLATYILTHRARLTEGRSVLELGAGAGLPSLVCGLSGGARTVVVTDYPDPDLVENLKINVEEVKGMMTAAQKEHCSIVAQGYLWGADVAPLLAHLKSQNGFEGHVTGECRTDGKFDLLILGDLLFNHSEHNKLLVSIRKTLARTVGAKALVFFTPYRPWLFDKDLAFFDLAKRVGSGQHPASNLPEHQVEEELKIAEDGFGAFKVEKVLEHVMPEVLFPNDRGDEMLRRTVFGFELSWGDLA